MTSYGQTDPEVFSDGHHTDVLYNVVRQMAQELASLQKALRQHQQRTAMELHEVLRQMEQKLEERDETVRALGLRLGERVRQLEEKVMAVEERLLSFATREGTVEVAANKSLGQLEDRVRHLETSVQRALDTVFPRVETLVVQLENISSPEAPIVSTSTSSSAPSLSSFSSSSFSSFSSFPNPSSRAVSGIGGATMKDTVGGSPQASQGTPDVEEEGEKQQVNFRAREVIKRRNKARASPSSSGEALCAAAEHGTLEGVRRLLDSGADVNYTDRNGDCPLLCALYRHAPNSVVVALLVERGADVNAVEDLGMCAMHYAAYNDPSGQCVRLLLSALANLDARTVDGETPLHWAAFNGNEATVRTLLEAGARKTLEAWSGRWKKKIAFDCARSDAVRELLRP